MAEPKKANLTSHTPGGVEIFFLQDHKTKDDIGTEYKAGEKVSMNEDSAGHFIRRGLACLASDRVAIADFNRRIKEAEGESEE